MTAQRCWSARSPRTMDAKPRMILALLMSSAMVCMVTLLVTFLDLSLRPDFLIQWVKSVFHRLAGRGDHRILHHAVGATADRSYRCVDRRPALMRQPSAQSDRHRGWRAFAELRAYRSCVLRRAACACSQRRPRQRSNAMAGHVICHAVGGARSFSAGRISKFQSRHFPRLAMTGRRRSRRKIRTLARRRGIFARPHSAVQHNCH